jgi:FixJ family two-component response regulator
MRAAQPFASLLVRGITEDRRLLNSPIVSIVDDDHAVRTSIANLVRSMGWQPQVFESAEAFLHSGQIDATACLISDVQMPGMSGPDMQLRLIEQNRVLPIIFITAFPNDALKSQVISNGALDMFTKPLDIAAILHRIELVLGTAGSTVA